MSRESKVLIGVGALVVIGLILALVGQPTIGVIAVLIGLVAGVAGLRLTKPDVSDPFADVRTEADMSNTGTLTPADPLAPWSPDGGLNAWTPPTDLATPPPAPTYEAPAYEAPAYEAPAYEAPAPEAPAYDPPIYDAPAETPSYEAPTYASLAEPEVEPASTGSWDDEWDSTVSWAPEAETALDSPVDHQQADLHGYESNPLDDLVGLDALDPIAEVERIEGRGSSLFGGDPNFHAPIINEQVSTADDIMAASQATELNLTGSEEQTELQKLLAKVQIRLSAYE
ncbi:MAG: hypothetical protein ACXV95_14095 [Acidimicrobiales bacterium]